jgi:hypothetical protein
MMRGHAFVVKLLRFASLVVIVPLSVSPNRRIEAITIKINTNSTTNKTQMKSA